MQGDLGFSVSAVRKTLLLVGEEHPPVCGLGCRPAPRLHTLLHFTSGGAGGEQAWEDFADSEVV